MADPTFFDLFKATWAQSGLTEGITELQYKTGWAFIGSVPPSVEQFNKVQQTTDERLAWIYKQLDGLAAVTGRPLAANGFDALSYALQNLNATNLKSGTVPVARLSGVATSLTAGAAQKLAAARTIAVTGDATGSGSFDGSTNLSFGLTLADSGVFASSYGAANSIPTFTVDAKGRITSAGAVAVGNAGTATKLATARSFSITGGATAAGVSFDGSGNVTLSVTALDVSKATAGTLGVARGGTGLATVAAGAYLTGAGTGAMVPRTPAEVLEDIQALPKAGGEVRGPILLGVGAALGSQYGANTTTAQTAHIFLPDGAGYSVHLGSIVGAMKITLPPVAIGINSMLRLRVDMFEYDAASTPVSILLSGYAQVTKAWSRCSATIIAGSQASDLPVRFGSDAGGNLCIWLGDTGKTWLYPTVVVTEVMAKYNSPGATVASWGTGWKTEAVTAFETVSVTLSSGNLAFARSDVVNVAGLQDALVQKAPAARILTAGNGLTGGGALDANRTFTLGTPTAITKDSTNSVSATSHTHQLDVTPADIGAASAATSILAGNGLTGGGTMAASRTLTLGTPSTLTATTANAVQSTSHSHALDTQTSATDATPGRMLLAGAFGLGSAAPGMTAYGFASDFNAIDGANVFVSIDKVMANGPLGAAAAAYVGQLRVSRRSLPGGVSAVQELFASDTSWIRFGSGEVGSTVWGAWQKQLTEQNLNVQAGANDSETGRLLTVGRAFGIGADNPLGTADLDTVLVPGKYGQSQNANATTARHYPTNKAGSLDVGMAGALVTTHVYVLYDTGEMYTRARYSAVWSDWTYHPGVARFPKSSESADGIAPLATLAEVNAGSNDTRIVTPKKLRWGISFSIGENGHIALPSWMGGLIIQWGSGAIPLNVASGVYFTGTATATLSIPFPKKIFGVYPSIQNTPNSLDTISVAGLTLSSISLLGATTDSGFQVPSYWYFAIGN